MSNFNENTSETLVVSETKLPKNAAFHVVPSEKLEMCKETYGGFLNATEEDLLILRVLNKFLVATSKMVTEYLNYSGYEITNIKVSKLLSKLTHYRAVVKYRFVTETSQSNYVVYKLWNVGAAILKENGENWRLKGYLEVECVNPSQIKKLLSANQVMIDMLFKEGYECITGQAIYRNNNNGRNSVFRAHGLAMKKDECIIVESIRRDEGHIVNIQNKLKRIDNTIRKEANIDLRGYKVKVIICTEDEEHMQSVMDSLKGYSPKYFTISYTFDLGVLGTEKKIKEYTPHLSFLSRLLSAVVMV